MQGCGPGPGRFPDAGRVLDLSSSNGEPLIRAANHVNAAALGDGFDHAVSFAALRRQEGSTNRGRFDGAPSTALYVEAESDNRPFFIIPWDGKYLIGTTDIRFKGDLDRPEIDDDEIDYLLRETNRVVSSARLTRDAILYTYAGVRPLPYTENKSEEDALAPIAVAVAGGGVSHTKTVTAISPAAAKRVFEKANKLAGSFRSAGT